MYRTALILSFAALLAFTACNSRINDNKGVVLARVHNEYLYEQDLAGIISSNTSHRDSIVMVRNYVNNWIKTRLMVGKARFNLTEKQLDFEKQLEEYENSLVIFEYESKLLNQELDTTVSEEQLRDYYENHLRDFELKENIIKVYYAILSSDLPEKDEIEKTFHLPDSLVIDSLMALANDYSFTLSVDTNKWVRFDELKRHIPIETYNQELFLKNKRFARISDSENCYMITFVDFKITDDISPFILVKRNIRDIILAKRKVALIKRVRQEIFEQAALNNEFEIYYNE